MKIMKEDTIPRLNIDKGFKDLIRPLTRQEYLQLEENILADGCRDPIAVWKGYIVDGHNRYEICRKHRIPFRTTEMSFSSREEAIMWICKNQLGRRNISDETRRYLIGIQYESEKLIAKKRNKKGWNQHIQSSAKKKAASIAGHPDISDGNEGKNPTADRIAKDNHISHSTVQKYAQYSRAVDTIKKKCPELYPKLLSGNFKISQDRIIELAGYSAADIRKMLKRTDSVNQPYVTYKETREEIMKADQKSVNTGPSIKDMPKFDPDAEVISLSLTIPAWISSLNRTRDNARFDQISDKTREKLSASLRELYTKTLEVLTVVEDK